ncbi:MAG: hypothetical protein JWR02_2402, partial [Mucilaginibacter sp.]|nr:hypothetical protein [Mucilaginibacter sp.]
MLKWIVIFIALAFGFLIALLGFLMLLYGILSFFVTFERNHALNTIGYYSFFIGVPVTALGIYILRGNWRYITGKESCT